MCSSYPTEGREVERNRVGGGTTGSFPPPCAGPWMPSSRGIAWAQRKAAEPEPSQHPLGWPVIMGAEGNKKGRLRQRQETTAGKPHRHPRSPKSPLHRHVGTAPRRALRVSGQQGPGPQPGKFKSPLPLCPPPHKSRNGFLRGWTRKSS